MRMTNADAGNLGRAVVLVAFAMSAALPVVAVLFRVTPFADGSFFVLSLLSPDPWDFGWESYPSRLTAFALTILPPFWIGRLTGNGSLAVGAYSAIMGLLPLAGLLATRRVAAPGSHWLTICAISTIVLAFSVTFFPTEMWLAHTLIWPLVALAAKTEARAGAILALSLVTAFVHEAAIPLVVLALLHGFLITRRVGLLLVLAAVAGVSIAVKLFAPIANGEIARTVGDNALNFLNPDNFVNNFTIVATLAVLLLLALRLILRPDSRRAEIMILAVVCAAAAAQIAFWPGPPHVMRRYVGRTIIFAGLSATLAAAILLQMSPAIAAMAERGRARYGDVLLGVLTVVVVVSAVGHVAETARFLRHWHTLERLIAGPMPMPADMPTGIVALASDGTKVEGTAAAALPTGELVDSPFTVANGAGPLARPPAFPFAAGWAVAWNWALPFHSAATSRSTGAEFLLIVVGSNFSPVGCATMRSLDMARTLASPARLRLLRDHLCALEAKRSTPPPRSSISAGPDRS